MKKKFFSLLEVTLSMALLGLLLSMMSGTFFRLYRINFAFKEIEGKLLESHLFDSFFREFIESTYPPFPFIPYISDEINQLLPRTFWTEKNGSSLSFLYSPREDHPDDLSTYVYAQLFVDKGRVRLDRRVYAPHSGLGLYLRTTYFFQNVKGLQFQFYCGFCPSEEVEVEENMRHPPFETSEWSSNDSILPTSVLLTITMESGVKEKFGYRLRSVPMLLHYD